VVAGFDPATAISLPAAAHPVFCIPRHPADTLLDPACAALVNAGSPTPVSYTPTHPPNHTLGLHTSRVRFLPRRFAGEAYLRLLRQAHVILHPFPYGGARTAAEGGCVRAYVCVVCACVLGQGGGLLTECRAEAMEPCA
jgi:hypothetical protein